MAVSQRMVPGEQHDEGSYCARRDRVGVGSGFVGVHDPYDPGQRAVGEFFGRRCRPQRAVPVPQEWEKGRAVFSVK